MLIKTMNCNVMLMKTVNQEPSMISVLRPNFLGPGIPNHGSTTFGRVEFMLDIHTACPSRTLSILFHPALCMGKADLFSVYQSAPLHLCSVNRKYQQEIRE